MSKKHRFDHTMSTYEDDHNIRETEAEASADAYEARDAPQDFEGFMAEVRRVTEAVRGGGLMVDEDLFEEVFGDAQNSRGASPQFIDALPSVQEAESESASCPVCLASHATILTEQEYAEVSDFAGDDLGLRRLPCKHVLCGKCARRWLRLNNTCPLCRAVMDSSVPPRNPVLDDPVIASSVASENYTNQMLSLFRAVFGRQEQHNDGQGENFRRQGRAEFSGMYS